MRQDHREANAARPGRPCGAESASFSFAQPVGRKACRAHRSTRRGESSQGQPHDQSRPVRIRRMPRRRRLGHFAAWLALVATLLSGVPPAGAHVRLVDRLDGHADYCSASGAIPPGAADSHPAGHDTKACTHCDGCTGNAGSHAAPLAATLQVIAPVAHAGAIATTGFDSVCSTVLIAAPPRGPPFLA
jgi:hypothetical protein